MTTLALESKPRPSMPINRLTMRVARAADRPAIYRLRHAVYATELGQHAENTAGELRDPLDEFNEYILVCAEDEMIGLVSITPPGHGRYSVDKYVPRDELPVPVDGGLYEVRLLTVAQALSQRSGDAPLDACRVAPGSTNRVDGRSSRSVAGRCWVSTKKRGSCRPVVRSARDKSPTN